MGVSRFFLFIANHQPVSVFDTSFTSGLERQPTARIRGRRLHGAVRGLRFDTAGTFGEESIDAGRQHRGPSFRRSGCPASSGPSSSSR
jgi:hypothetical protein